MSKPRWLLFCIMLSLSAHAYAGDNTIPAVSSASLSPADTGLYVQPVRQQVTLPDPQATTTTHRDAAGVSIKPYGTAASGHLDLWLMLLVAAGLVVLQLRRKQKSLPQRPVGDSENKLFWG